MKFLESWSFGKNKILLMKNKNIFIGTIIYENNNKYNDIKFTGNDKKEVFNTIKSFIYDKFGIIPIKFEM